jgi:hypothetical protein
MSNRNCGIIEGMKAWHQSLCRDETAAVRARSTSLVRACLPSTGRRVMTGAASNIEQHAARLGSR